MEVSSHGVDLKRIEGCAFDVGVFTNLSQDHLDYHQNMEAYWECKRRFFTHHLGRGEKKEKAVAVLNTDSDEGRSLATGLDIPVLTVGSHAGDGVHPDQVRFDLDGITVIVPDFIDDLKTVGTKVVTALAERGVTTNAAAGARDIAHAYR